MSIGACMFLYVFFIACLVSITVCFVWLVKEYVKSLFGKSIYITDEQLYSTSEELYSNSK